MKSHSKVGHHQSPEQLQYTLSQILQLSGIVLEEWTPFSLFPQMVFDDGEVQNLSFNWVEIWCVKAIKYNLHRLHTHQNNSVRPHALWKSYWQWPCRQVDTNHARKMLQATGFSCNVLPTCMSWLYAAWNIWYKLYTMGSSNICTSNIKSALCEHN